MPINSAVTAEIFVVFKTSKIKMKTFIFLKWYGIFLLGAFMRFILWRKCNLFVIFLRLPHSDRDYHYSNRIAQATATAPVL